MCASAISSISSSSSSSSVDNLIDGRVGGRTFMNTAAKMLIAGHRIPRKIKKRVGFSSDAGGGDWKVGREENDVRKREERLRRERGTDRATVG